MRCVKTVRFPCPGGRSTLVILHTKDTKRRRNNFIVRALFVGRWSGRSAAAGPGCRRTATWPSSPSRSTVRSLPAVSARAGITAQRLPWFSLSPGDVARGLEGSRCEPGPSSPSIQDSYYAITQPPSRPRTAALVFVCEPFLSVLILFSILIN